MALLAGHGGVQADKGEACDIVFEFDILAPASFIVTFLALLAFLALVHVIDLVTGITIGGKLSLIYMCFVA